jgi:hypothetical protein
LRQKLGHGTKEYNEAWLRRFNGGESTWDAAFEALNKIHSGHLTDLAPKQHAEALAWFREFKAFWEKFSYHYYSNLDLAFGKNYNHPGYAHFRKTPWVAHSKIQRVPLIRVKEFFERYALASQQISSEVESSGDAVRHIFAMHFKPGTMGNPRVLLDYILGSFDERTPPPYAATLLMLFLRPTLAHKIRRGVADLKLPALSK